MTFSRTTRQAAGEDVKASERATASNLSERSSAMMASAQQQRHLWLVGLARAQKGGPARQAACSQPTTTHAFFPSLDNPTSQPSVIRSAPPPPARRRPRTGCERDPDADRRSASSPAVLSLPPPHLARSPAPPSSLSPSHVHRRQAQLEPDRPEGRQPPRRPVDRQQRPAPAQRPRCVSAAAGGSPAGPFCSLARSPC